MDHCLLPDEIIEQIVKELFTCTEHGWANYSCPCLAFHSQRQHSKYTPLRTISRLFAQTLNKPIFQDLSCKGDNRYEHFVNLSSTTQISPLVRKLRLDITPRDLGRAWSDEIHGYPAGDRARYYFDDLRRYLIPSLSRLHNLQELFLTTNYSGLHLAGISRGELLMPCFKTLCTIIREAKLPRLEEVQIGVPYEGGYANFFQDKDSKRVLDGIKGQREEKNGMREWDVPQLRKVSVKLSDWQDNFTIMEFGMND